HLRQGLAALIGRVRAHGSAASASGSPLQRNKPAGQVKCAGGEDRPGMPAARRPGTLVCMSRALLIVDVQNDFTENGALAVEGGDAAAAGISDLLTTHAADYAVIIASRDWHDADGDNGGHFSREPDYTDSWPVHCVADTEGAAYDPLLVTDAITHHVRKGQGIPAYSMFEGRAEDGATVGEILSAHGVTDADVVGI